LNSLFPKGLVNKIEIILILYLLLSASGFQEPPRVVNLIMGATATGFAFLVMFFHWKRVIYLLTKDPFLWALIAMAVASVFWSSHPDSTSLNTKYLLRLAIFSSYLALRYSTRDLIRLLSWYAGLALVLSVVFGLLFPAYSIQHLGTAWVGIFGHKQSAGTFMGFAATLFTIHCFDKRSNLLLALMGMGLTIALVLLSMSKTGLVLCVLPLLFMPLYKIAKQGKYRAVLLTFALILGCFAAATVIINLETIVVGWLGKDLEFNGRLPLWLPSIASWLHQPWLGYGFHGFWNSEESDSVLLNTWLGTDPGFRARSVIANAHQGFIDLALQLGAVGFTLFITNFLLLLKRIIDLLLLTRLIDYFWMLLFLCYFLVINLVESNIILEQGHEWIIYVSISLKAALEYSRLRELRPMRSVSQEHYASPT
jgi:exopolysaccharide production protein ExoQ